MLRILAASLLLSLAACASDDPAAPSAPTSLAVGPLGTGAHLTWRDNSGDEDEFVVMRLQTDTDAAMKEVARVPFNTATYHDEPVTSGATFMYMVVATNAGGDSSSNQATFVAP